MVFTAKTFRQIFPLWLWPSILLAGYLAFLAHGPKNPVTYGEGKMLGSIVIASILALSLINIGVRIIARTEFLIWPSGVVACVFLMMSQSLHAALSGLIYGAVFLAWGVIVRPVISVTLRALFASRKVAS